ncbi:hypothetical protein [Prochlorococcus sp. MIT 1306]|uniref:hypothetical protein n=1 Tax=Prochlorococcus sp. MIT 1306 TaxID=1799667 RepID=UPI0039B4F939
MADTTTPTQANLQSGDGYGTPTPDDTGGDWTAGQSGTGDTKWWTGDAETATVNNWSEYIDTISDLRMEVDVSGTDDLPRWSNGSVNYSFGSKDGELSIDSGTQWMDWNDSQRGAGDGYPMPMATSAYDINNRLKGVVQQYSNGATWVGGESVFLNIDPNEVRIDNFGLHERMEANINNDFPGQAKDFLRESPDVQIELTSDFIDGLTEYAGQDFNDSYKQIGWAEGPTGTREISLDVLVDSSLTKEEKYNYLQEKLDINLEIDANVLGVRHGSMSWDGRTSDGHNPGMYFHLNVGDNENNDWSSGTSGSGGPGGGWHPTDDLNRYRDALSTTTDGTTVVEYAIGDWSVSDLIGRAGRYFDDYGQNDGFETTINFEARSMYMGSFLSDEMNLHVDRGDLTAPGFKLVGSLESYELAAGGGEDGFSFDFSSPGDTAFDFGFDTHVDVFDLVDRGTFKELVDIDLGSIIDGYTDSASGHAYVGVNYNFTVEGRDDYSRNGHVSANSDSNYNLKDAYFDTRALADIRDQNKELIGTDTVVYADATSLHTGIYYREDGIEANANWNLNQATGGWENNHNHGWGNVDLNSVFSQIIDTNNLHFKIENLFTDDLPDVSISSVRATLNGFGDVYQGDAAAAFTYQLFEANSNTALDQLGVLGQTVGNQRFGGIDYSKRYELQVTGETLADNYSLEGADITIAFDPVIFKNITAEDIQIGKNFNVANAVEIDNEAGTIRIAAASLGDLGEGSPITNETVLASIALDFDEQSLANPAPGESEYNNADGSLFVSPLTFNITANQEETVFSRKFNDGTGFTNREISSLSDLGGAIAVEGQDVTLYQALINIEEQGDGLIIGTDRVIGSDATFTNLIRSGDTVSATSEWLNVGNTDSNNLVVSAYGNANAELVGHSFVDGKTSLNSGNFKNGVFIEDDRESTKLVADIKVTGDAGKVVDLADGILSITADDSDVFINEKGSSNLITYQGDLNYDGRVSMKDLAYLNAGAARQQSTSQNTGEDLDNNGVVDASVAHDVDADFNGKIDLADLSVLDADWGKSLHDGDQNFVGSGDVSWNELDSQGTTGDAAWDNDSFKNQNAIEASSDYVSSLEAPGTSGVIGADGNEDANDNDMQGDVFQDPLTL